MLSFNNHKIVGFAFSAAVATAVALGACSRNSPGCRPPRHGNFDRVAPGHLRLIPPERPWPDGDSGCREVLSARPASSCSSWTATRRWRACSRTVMRQQRPRSSAVTAHPRRLLRSAGGVQREATREPQWWRRRERGRHRVRRAERAPALDQHRRHPRAFQRPGQPERDGAVSAGRPPSISVKDERGAAQMVDQMVTQVTLTSVRPGGLPSVALGFGPWHRVPSGFHAV